MGTLYRFGISLEKKLIDAFDKHIKGHAYLNRSEAIRDLIRDDLLRQRWAEDSTVAGAVVMTYDHHKRDLANKLLDTQHEFQDLIISSQHVHLDRRHCLEIIAVKGNARRIEALAAQLRSFVGVMHAGVSISPASGHLCQPDHTHAHTHGHGHKHRPSSHNHH
jgi:CopG family nickel-responsive transcriptional regulator